MSLDINRELAALSVFVKDDGAGPKNRIAKLKRKAKK